MDSDSDADWGAFAASTVGPRAARCVPVAGEVAPLLPRPAPHVQVESTLCRQDETRNRRKRNYILPGPKQRNLAEHALSCAWAREGKAKRKREHLSQQHNDSIEAAATLLNTSGIANNKKEARGS